MKKGRRNEQMRASRNGGLEVDRKEFIHIVAAAFGVGVQHKLIKKARPRRPS